MSTRILLVDDHQILREGLRALLEKEPDLEVVGEAENGRQALQLSREWGPDVVVMDLTMPDMNGFEAMRQLRDQVPGAFELQDPSELLGRGQLGLMGMQERAGLLGGTLDLASEPCQGTTVSLRIPSHSSGPPAPSREILRC